MDVTNHSASTNKIFERIKVQIGVEVDAIINRVNEKYGLTYIDSVGFDLGYDSIEQILMTSFNEQLIQPISLLQKEAIEELQLSIIHIETARIMENQAKNKERVDEMSLEIWNKAFSPARLSNVTDLRGSDFIQKKRDLDQAVYISTVKKSETQLILSTESLLISIH